MRYTKLGHSMIEKQRKFLVERLPLNLADVGGEQIIQGYVSDAQASVESKIRIIGGEAFISLKADTSSGRQRYTVSIPVEIAKEIIDNLVSKPVIRKTRYTTSIAGVIFDIDEFHDNLQGLVLAEVENQDVDKSQFDWLGREVTDDKRFRNTTLFWMGLASV